MTTSFKLPPLLELRPKDSRGYPITYVTGITKDGDPDFTAIDGLKVYEVGKKRLCGLCGHPLAYWIAFIGGPKALKNRAYADPPMHPDCAKAAMELCPYIIHGRARRAVNTKVESVIPEGFSGDKPEMWILILTRGFKWQLGRDQTMLFRPNPPVFMDYYEYDDQGVLSLTKSSR